MSSYNPHFSGPSELLGPVITSKEFVDWEIMDNDSPDRMRRLLKHMAEEANLLLALDAGYYVGVDLSDAKAVFVKKEEFAIGRDNAKSQPRFGQMIINGGPQSALYNEPELVAIKPYDDRQSLYREWAAAAYLNDTFPRQVAYLNLGVHSDEDGEESIISQYDHSVVSLDRSFNADPELDPGGLRPNVIRRHALMGMKGLGMFHGVRMTHGDAQAKNLAYDMFGPRAIDLEGAQVYSEEDSYADDIWLNTRRDITAFIHSIVMVEENKSQIVDALKSGKIQDALIKKYIKGVKEGRSVMRGEYVPDFGRQNTEVIQEQLNKILQ